jgi:signal transduction histidine kinase/CheY-like chemotaxis protein
MPTYAPANYQTRKIKWLYILALSMVAILTITGQALVQWSLSALQGDSTTVNIAGRQRMLSQRIPRIILALDANRRSPEIDPLGQQVESPNRQSVENLQESLNLWRANHVGLANASQSVGLSTANSDLVSELFAQIEPDFFRVEKIAKSVIERLPNIHSELMNADERTQLIRHSDSFLSLMDAIVAQYELEAKQRVGRLQWIERGLLLGTLLVLICEGLFIFSPAIASLNRAFQRLSAVTNQLELAKESAEQANRAKTQFLARVSHELRTPLHAILGMLGLIRQGRLTHGQQQRANLAYNAARTLRHLVDDLLDISSVECGSPLTLHLEKTDVPTVASDCVRLMMQHARRKRLSLRLVNELPESTLYLLDEYRVRQILINLLQNAIRYTQTGEIECRTWLEAGEHNPHGGDQAWLSISVRDTGCGIAPENLDQIFENFVRINPQDGKQEIGPRLGLGLPITASLVAMMQGTISVESQLGIGSTFSVRLPTVSTKQENVSESSESNPQTASKKTLYASLENDSVSALVVDDSKVNRQLLRAYLKRLGIKACSTNNLARALALYTERHPQLVLLDLHVGSQNSLSLANSIRNLPGGNLALIYIITADSHFQLANTHDACAIAGILHKPIEFEELSTQLKSALATRDQMQQSEPIDAPTDFHDLRASLRSLLAEQLPSEINKLNEAFANQDFKTIQLIAHRLRGSAANAGWHELTEAASKLETHPNSVPSFTLLQ